MTAPPRSSEMSELDAVREALEPDYEILRELGRGGMAIVYHGRERDLGREVAIKVLPPTLAFDTAFVERFQREARTSASLEHPHIVPVYRVGRSGRVSYFVMKLLRGRSLSALLEERGQLGAAETRRILRETASALGYAARHGVVHRDVKPDNIMLDEDGRCTVTDFGIARSAADAKLTATGMSVGTPRYMSPEQARAKEVDGRSDLYSLGIVAYECLVGHTPFDGDDAFAILMDHVNAPLPQPALATHEEWDLFEVVQRMLAKRPEDRFQSADELIAALDAPRTPAADATVHGRALDRTAPPRAAAVREPEMREPDRSGPRPSAALDAALDAGVQLLRQQRPRVGAGLAAGRDVLAKQAPRARAAVSSAIATLGGLPQRARSVGRRTWIAMAAAALVSVGGYQGFHFATKHRTRCPLATAPVAGETGDSSAVARRPALTLLVDAVGTLDRGDDVELYYDVCGLPKGAPYTTTVAITKNGGGLRKLFGGGVGPVTATFDEGSRGEATRRHRTVPFGEMPVGSYTLDLRLTDADGRVRTRSVAFQVTGD